MFFNVGNLLPTVLAIWLPKADGSAASYSYMKFIIAFPMLMTTITLLSFLLVYRTETPNYLISKGKQEESLKTLKIFYAD